MKNTRFERGLSCSLSFFFFCQCDPLSRSLSKWKITSWAFNLSRSFLGYFSDRASYPHFGRTVLRSWAVGLRQRIWWKWTKWREMEIMTNISHVCFVHSVLLFTVTWIYRASRETKIWSFRNVLRNCKSNAHGETVYWFSYRGLNEEWRSLSVLLNSSTTWHPFVVTEETGHRIEYLDSVAPDTGTGVLTPTREARKGRSIIPPPQFLRRAL